VTHIDPNVINDAFRGGYDDVVGGITSQSPIAAVDTNWTQAVDTKFHVVMLATETAGGDATSYNFRLEYNLNSGGWNDVTTSTPIQAVAPTNCTTADASSYGTTALTTGATIQATQYDTDGTDSATVSINNASIEYTTCVQIDSAQVANNDTIQLRLTNAGTALDADTTIPTITVSEAAPDALLADDIESASNVTAPAIGQEHALTATSIESASEVTAPVVGQEHTLLADDIESASELTNPAASHIHVLSANDVESSSEVTVTALSQVHNLSESGVESKTETQSPAITQAHGLSTENLQSRTHVDVPRIGFKLKTAASKYLRNRETRRTRFR
jgi:hypothetical protein